MSTPVRVWSTVAPADGHAVIVHAGAGAWTTAERRAAGVAACRRAATEAGARLDAGATAVDAACAAVRVLEDDPIANAGTGSVPTSAGTVELDASVMDGATGRAGAVGALPPFRHPVDAALAVLRHSPHVLLVGEGAGRFARDHGLEPVPAADLLVTADGLAPLAYDAGDTVGAVARDAEGRLAAATSTGGTPGQAPGRLGDTPVIGAGTYASGARACSCTGDGEAFLRACTAFWAVAVAPGPLAGVAEEALARIDRDHGRGGLVLVDAGGGIAAATATGAMPFAYAGAGGVLVAGDLH